MENRKIVISKAHGPQFEKQFFLDIQEAILDGWRIVDNKVLLDQSMRNFMGYQGRAVFYKPEDEAKVEPIVEAPVEPSEEGKKEEVSTPAQPKKTRRRASNKA